MVKLNGNSEQKGTLLIEAIAMLALIAMVTPTLYKKSAERMMEIQDINIASQMRSLDGVVESFVKTQGGDLATAGSSGSTIEICYEDNTSGCYSRGFSSFVPFGFKYDDVKHFLRPRIYVYSDDNKLQYYIVYPHDNDLGRKRATKLASLVGANGGVVQVGGFTGVGSQTIVQGTGGAWMLESDDVEEVNFDEGVLTNNSIVVTSEEPIVIDRDENEYYLYRVPPETGRSDWYRNQMITDLYMGGNYDEAYPTQTVDYYSIFNVRKLTLNTKCNYEHLIEGVDDNSTCIPEEVADLYIGKPAKTSEFRQKPGSLGGVPRYYGTNEGAAWIYGNLSALNDHFRVFRSDDGSSALDRDASGYDIMQFARLNDGSEDWSRKTYDDDSSVALQIFRAENADDSARVSMMNGLVNVVENAGNMVDGVGEIYLNATHALVVGHSSSAGGEGSLISAFHDNDRNVVLMNSFSDSSDTFINRKGGDVFINAVYDSSGAGAFSQGNTFINHAGGLLSAGRDEIWLKAQGDDGSAEVHILNSDSSGANIFTVGNSEFDSDMNTIYADYDRTALQGGRFRVYKEDMTDDLSSNVGGSNLLTKFNDPTDLSSGATVVATQTLDVLGSTYFGSGAMVPEGDDGIDYMRADWEVGVAGSAWVDKLLWARQAWLKDAGMAQLHAGFSSFAEYRDSPKVGWLNVYNPDDLGVIIRNKTKNLDENSEYTSNDLLFQAYSSGVEIWGNADDDSSNTPYGIWQEGSTMIGLRDNMFHANIDSVNLQGSTLANIYTVDTSTDGVVNIQNNAMQFRGEAGSSGAYANEILAQANWFGVTADSSYTDSTDVQFRVGQSDEFEDIEEVRVRNADFAVRDSSSGVGRFYVRPDDDYTSSYAHVNVDGSFHVTGNEVIHISSRDENSAERDSSRAMFEVDPNYVQVWARNGSSYADLHGSTSSNYHAMLKINPNDVSGEASDADDVDDASIYIRKGAIELQRSYGGTGSSGVGFAADEGYGYIKANRFVSNADVAGIPKSNTGSSSVESYDQYMINPAYTSVMHDIKLTTRGGARLSDVLPDYVLKGVYNISNDFLEGSETQRIAWSCGNQCSGGPYSGVSDNVRWANSYVGNLPFAMCPPGYMNLATLVPTSFMMGVAGDILPTGSFGWGASTTGDYAVNLTPRQSAILAKAKADVDVAGKIAYPGLREVSSMVYNSISFDPGFASSYADFQSKVEMQSEGWYMGFDAGDSSNVNEMIEIGGDLSEHKIGIWKFTDKADGSPESYVVAQPLYFQQNTWLKTSVVPHDKGWDAYAGFIYDKNSWPDLGSGAGGTGITSNNTIGSSAVPFQGYGTGGNYVWNLFPIPTNSIEGHATVYCYFNRGAFSGNGWEQLVDPIDQVNTDTYRAPANEGGTKAGSGNAEYLERLNDPTLKYDDPW